MIHRRLGVALGALAIAGLAACSPSASPPPSASAVPATARPTGEPASTPTPPRNPPSSGFDPTTVSLSVEPFAAGLSALTFVAAADDGPGLLYAVEQVGRIWVVDSSGSVDATPLLDISDRVRSGGEQGLLGLAFHPDFAHTGRMFVDYTDSRGDSVVSEFLMRDGALDPDTEKVVLRVEQPYSNHNGGMLAFGPDGYLYIGLGDGGGGGDPQGNGQNPATLLATILRIDVDAGDPYAIPDDNPFAGSPGDARPEVWDYGLRNPWRFSFDSVTGALFIGDVGQSSWEEIDAEPAGQGGRNYGWNVMEGEECYAAASCSRDGLTLPVAVYGHDQGCSVSGGYVYRGAAIPGLYGGYVYADYCSGRLWVLDADAALASGTAMPSQAGQLPFAVASFGRDQAGELYVVDLAGAIYRLIEGGR